MWDTCALVGYLCPLAAAVKLYLCSILKAYLVICIQYLTVYVGIEYRLIAEVLCDKLLCCLW